ncbi:MAG: methyltransferase type 11 [Hyphomicrobiales bacterium]|nr:MAG: methyltransferase type 11 [Hyphomicrobiales bacterium]
MPQEPKDWQAFHKRRSQLEPPFRLDQATVDEFKKLILGHDAHVLELGVTPELAQLGQTLTAIDWSANMLEHIWPGDTPTRRAVLSDWRTMPAFDPAPTAVVGDGSLGCTAWPEPYEQVFARLKAVLSKGARIVIRCYISPDHPEEIIEIADDVNAGNMLGFHAFKLRLAMAVASENGGPNVVVKDILTRFNEVFPDRLALAKNTGWSLERIGEMDAYNNSEAIYSFATRKQVVQIIPSGFSNVHFVDAGKYELSERCPLLVMDFTP